VPKDTPRTRFEGVYARHRVSCATATGGSCTCKPSHWGEAWDRASNKHRKTSFLHSPTAARNARNDLKDTLRAGMLPASSTIEIRHARVEDVDLDLGVIYLGADDRGRKSRAAQRAVPIVEAPQRPVAVPSPGSRDGTWSSR
jgi:hypothetical protein